MSEKLAKYIITTGKFDGETNSIKQARKELKKHVERMRQHYPQFKHHTYGIYMLVEKSE